MSKSTFVAIAPDGSRHTRTSENHTYNFVCLAQSKDGDWNAHSWSKTESGARSKINDAKSWGYPNAIVVAAVLEVK